MCLAIGAVYLYHMSENSVYGDGDGMDNSSSAVGGGIGAGEWMEVLKLLPSDGTWGDYFGTSVSMHGDVLVVGAPQHYNYYSNSYWYYTYGT